MQKTINGAMFRKMVLAAANLLEENRKYVECNEGVLCSQKASEKFRRQYAEFMRELFEMGIDQIEYAAEISLEHHLGLTCDPVCGLVQIPCIERNAVAAMRAINSLSLANFLSDSRKISFDLVVETMYQTGIDLSHHYRETSEGGLAKLYKN